MEIRDILICFSIKYNGDFDRIYKAITKKEEISFEEFEEMKKMNLKVITCLDANYPQSLKNCYKPPLVLFYKGDISLLNEKYKLAVVGSREPSIYGKEATVKILDELLIKQEIIIVSGLARGIDSLAHKEALKNNCKTIAVLGCGLNNYFPYSNIELRNDIEEYGLVISEYPPFVEARSENFPLRNRIIAALSDAVLICDAKKRSGTQITANYALEFGKDILCIPHSILEENLCNILIKEGAIPVFDGDDISDILLN